MENSLNFLSTRKGFNVSLKHFRGVTAIIKQIENSKNLADILNNQLETKGIEQYQISAILNALLIDKYNYHAKSICMKTTSDSNLSEIAKITKGWSAFDVVLSYFHPQLGLILINPKNEKSWSNVDLLKENELVVIYIGNYNKSFDIKNAIKCTEEIEKLLNGEIKETKLKFSADTVAKTEEIKPVAVKPVAKSVQQPAKPAAPVVQKSASEPPASNGKKTMSPQYGVTVSNELFHNGNVEAWKKIINSYEATYPDIKVLLFYEGEQIHDINTLFKWGKVKHGTNIYFRLLGTEFKDISKIRRYLNQGASSRYEDFLKGDPTKILKLF